MVSNTQKYRLGVFIVIVSLLMLFLILMVAGKAVIERRDEYTIVYRDISVSGLQLGGSVKYHGINIGRIDDISIDQDDVQNVVVLISIKKGTPIKEDVKASLTPVGITGLLQIELAGGTNESALLEPGGEIKAGTSLMASLSSRAEVLADKIDILLGNLAEITSNENQEKINNILDNIDFILESNKEEINSVVTNLDSISYHLTNLTESTSIAVERLNQIINSDQVTKILDNTEKFSTDVAQADVTNLLNNLDETINEIRETFTHLDLTHLKVRQDLIQSVESLKETLEYLNEFSRQISEEPSMLIRSKKK
jgi:phospholipid/cholesterol/gamma-HCH transport system substrate-binding protein